MRLRSFLSVTPMLIAAAIALPAPARATPVRDSVMNVSPLVSPVGLIMSAALPVISRDYAFVREDRMAVSFGPVPTLRDALQTFKYRTGRLFRDQLPRRDRLL